MNPPPTQQELKDLLSKNEIVPQVLSTGTISNLKSPLQIIYSENIQDEKNNLILGLGEEVERSKLQEIPDLLFTEADSDSTYTLLMIDPDLSHQNDKLIGQVNHWYQPNLQFESETKLAKFNELSAKSYTEYVGPTPGPGTGFHRYIFILAREPHHYSPTTNKLPQGNSDLKGRINFNVENFLKEENLLNNVEAIGFFKVKADLKSTIDNAGMVAESVVNKVLGK